MKQNKDFADWALWFQDYLGRQIPIPWNDNVRVPVSLRQVIAHSVAQFQLGESSEAKTLKAKVARWVRRGGDRHYQIAIDGFVHEENRHARLLGRWMAIEGIPTLKAHPADWLFRQARRWVPLRYSLVVLVSAEMLAFPYYRTLRDISDSAILAAISNQILLDEEQHLRFQAMAIRHLLGNCSYLRMRAARSIAALLLELATDALWFHHAPLFRAAGMQFADLRRAARAEFLRVWTYIETGSWPVFSPASLPAHYTPSFQP